MDALRAMTSAGADAIGASGKGRLAAGSDADLVALDGNPLADPGAIHRLQRVWRAGLAVC
jgi:imidazolonepropionase-like amidohydrolase